MKLFENISDFSKTEDYLPIINGAINADIIIIFLVFHGVFSSYYIKKWYKTFQLSACIIDISILHLFSFQTPILLGKKIRKNVKSIVGISPTMVLLFPVLLL